MVLGLHRMNFICAGMAVALLLNWACSEKKAVQMVQPKRVAMVESFSEPAKTRLEDTYLITMPVAGRIGRLEWEPGDAVKKEQELGLYDRVPFETEREEARALVEELRAQILVNEYNKLEETAAVQTQAMVESTLESIKAAKAQVEAQVARADRYAKELARLEKMASDQSITQSRLDDAALDAETAGIDLKKEEFTYAAMKAILTAVQTGPRLVQEYLGRKHLEREVLVHQLTQAQARLTRAEHDYQLAELRAPIDGVVLERYEDGDRTLNAGAELMRIGDLARLEAIADVLTQDALQISLGTEVWLEAAAGMEKIRAKVVRIEPAGFTKLSSLGVEQQRVNVIAAIDSPPAKLGVGYQVQAQFIKGKKENALTLPRSSIMQGEDQVYFVYCLDRGTLRKNPVTLGLRGDREMELVEGVAEEDWVVLYPDSSMMEGQPVTGLKE
ncbi:MAG: HlyD family efflux transporter periplasmic adaptor subunit [bacterium]|jgi:HlyD family secretion protein|nr:HlyD family efflux transporter periplasmic adaptor subunit [bacterium]